MSDGDRKNLGELEYLPQPGFPVHFFPFMGNPDYLSPLVALRFKNLKGKLCYFWSETLFYKFFADIFTTFLSKKKWKISTLKKIFDNFLNSFGLKFFSWQTCISRMQNLGEKYRQRKSLQLKFSDRNPTQPKLIIFLEGLFFLCNNWWYIYM